MATRRLREYREFFQQFRQSFQATGSLVPSSRWLARALTRPFRNRQTPARILEVGPGTGAVTREIVALLEDHDRLDLVELNDRFVVHLRDGFDDGGFLEAARERVRLFHTPIEAYEADHRYDFIISGLPLNNFSADLVGRLFGKFSELLVPGGYLSFFEYQFVRRVKCITALGGARRRLHDLDAVITEQLVQNAATRDRVFRNFPPAWAHHVQLAATTMPPLARSANPVEK